MNYTLKRDLTLLFASAALMAAGYSIARVQADGAPTVQPLWYSGTVSDAQGKPLTGNHKASVRLFDTADKAAQSLCVVGPKDVGFDSGRFRMDVSQCESKQQTAAVFAGKADLYVELTIDEDSKPFDRAKIGAVPFAVEAQHAVSASRAQPGTPLHQSIPLIQSGRIQANSQNTKTWNATGTTMLRVSFDAAFAEVPTVQVMLGALDGTPAASTSNPPDEIRVSLQASAVDVNGFTLSISTWAGSQVLGADAVWIAVGKHP